ncbi:protein SCAF11 isoform X2 [Alligator sinensis]|nr:protein SCAF11 isoform X2 [Alligator sinensis]XP_025064338.1 protein SCAF11 isoform X2 [Alligator sinensis]XP_025064341.1 protein SCAF11 isoform X2 [Alligator sinensis]
MKNKKQYVPDVEGQKHEDMEGEEKEDSCSCSAGLLYDEGDRCPICLNCLLEQEVGFPENCSHIFCMTCILKWAEIMALCPIDRKPFQAVCKFDSLCIKVQVRQLREKEEKENCCCNKGKCCHINIKGFKRKDGQLEKGPLIAKLCKDVEKNHSDISTDDRKKTASVKMDKPRRQTCSSEHFRNHFYSKIPSSIRTGESFSGYRSDCTELTEINAMIRQKRQEMELLWSSARARVESIPFMSCEAEAEIETFLLASTSIPGTVFPTNSRPLENFESSGKGYAVAHTQGGEEKKQASGTSGTRGTRKKPTNTTPRRRSARNSKNEAMSQSRSSPRSSNSRCSAPDDDDSSLKVSPAAPEEKPLPKRKSKRGVKQQAPVVKKKLRSSMRTEKSSSDSVEDDEAAESDAPPVLDQDHQSDNESLLHKNNAETESANGLESCSEHVENEEIAKDYAQERDILEDADLGSCTQEPPALQEESQKVEIKSGDENVADFENEDVCENTFEMVNTMNSPRNELLEHSVTLKKIDQTFSPQDELLENTETLTEAYQSLDSPREKLLEYPESVENDDKSFDSPRNKLSEPTDSVDLDGCEDKEKKSSGKSAMVPNSPVQDALTDVLITTIQDVNKLDQSFKEESMPVNKEVRIAESSKIITEQSNTHFNEDNNEIIPMECDSFCSDQAESHIEQSPSLDCVKPVETNSLSQETENCTLLSDKKGESSLHETECPTEFKKDKKTRTRRSRFHSPSTTWSPSKKGGRKSESPSPKRETIKEGERSRSPKKETDREGRRSQSPKKETDREGRRTRSPKKETDREGRRTRSPKKETDREGRRSPSPKKETDREGRWSRSPKRETDREGRRSPSPKKEADGEGRWSRSPKRETDREGRRSPSPKKEADGEGRWSRSPKRETDREGRRSPSPKKEADGEGRWSRSPKRETDREGRRSPSPKKEADGEGRWSRSPKRETDREGRRSPSPKKEADGEGRWSRSPKRETDREGRRSPSPKKEADGEGRWSRSPKRETDREGRRTPSRSPKRETVRESRRSPSRSRVKDFSPRQKSRSQSKDRDNDRDGQRRERDRDRRSRRWSRSRSRSRSRSPSRTRNMGPSYARNERGGHSPRWKEKWSNDSWKSPRGTDRYKRGEQEKQNENMKKEKDNIDKDSDDQCLSDKYGNDYPDWVMERINSVPETRSRERETFKDPQWEDNRCDNSGYSWNKNFGSGWISNRGRGGRVRGGRGRGGFMYGDRNENHWQNRKPLSGNSNGSGNETVRFPEHQPYRHKNEQDFSFDTPADRSGWTSASSWAVRKTLPADVQNYYSRRGRNSSSPQSGWMRQEEETSEQDPNLKDQTNQQGEGSQLPINMMQQQMNVMPQVNAQHQPMNIFPYPVSVPPPMMNIQHNPFNIRPPIPLHLHAGVPLIQVAPLTSVTQGLPPPPPPPPPSQQVNYITSQQDGKQLQGMPNALHVSNNMTVPVLPAPTAALGNVETVQGPASGNATSSSHIKNSNAAVKVGESKGSITVEASADSSKKDQKLLIQEKAAQEVKLAIKPFYQNKDISKEEYKEIVRKAVDKVCHSKSGEVNSTKVANLVKAYVDKYKHSRKKNPEEAFSAERK